MNDHGTTRPPTDPAGTTPSGSTDRFATQVQQVLRTLVDAIARLVREGNRRRLTLRNREGEVWVRMPLTLAVLLALLLIPYWPLLLALIVIGFAVGAQLGVERHQRTPGQASGGSDTDPSPGSGAP